MIAAWEVSAKLFRYVALGVAATALVLVTVWVTNAAVRGVGIMLGTVQRRRELRDMRRRRRAGRRLNAALNDALDESDYRGALRRAERSV